VVFQKNIAFRKKIPFNEGGTGIKNQDVDELERFSARNFIIFEDLIKFVRDQSRYLIQLGFLNNNHDLTRKFVEENYEQMALCYAAFNTGLFRLLQGNVFRENMPDTIYSTDIINKYKPKQTLKNLIS